MSGISWTVLAGLMRALSVLAVAGGAKGVELQKLLSIVATLLERGEAGRHKLEVLCAKIDVMVAQGREPTSAEWAELVGRSDAAHEIIQAAAKSDDPPPPPPVESEGGETDEGAKGTSKARKK
jgi:hypothetical protein